MVRQWVLGRSISRGWKQADEGSVVLLRIGDPERMVSYVVDEADFESAAGLAEGDDHPAELSWLSVVTNEPDNMMRRIRSAGLEYRRTEWLMSVDLARQPVRRAPASYGVEVVRRGEVVQVRVQEDDELAARGQMVVMGNDAVVDMVWTEPEHRRRGLGGAVMSRLAEEAQKGGAERGLLAASVEGRQLYNTLNWETFAEILVARTTG
ncbi:GNAT family N-acetyltransferase [Kribbella sp. NPDC006257]|uniref:GNAT family N-acetyltransferase n=1 Tax=Kribbella sp. NPDC006257 TaxID=3156738 RepID=UPI0033AB6081